MSIIYDALKKAEKTLGINPKAKINTDAPKTLPARFKINPRVFTISIYVAVAILGLILAKAIFNHITAREKSNEKFTQVEIKQISAAEEKIQAHPATIPETEPASPGQKPPKSEAKIKKELQKSFELNGIFFTDGAGYAIINNRVVKVADVVSGATVKRINLDSVELESSGVVFELRNPR